ncbi:CocE/NonD family hydrolase [Ekhidna sp.]
MNMISNRFLWFLLILQTTLAQSQSFEVKSGFISLESGIKLYHDLYLPMGQKKIPTILIRTPYGKGGSKIFASHFAKNGFSVVVQDVRGMGDSEGEFTSFNNEKSDGIATLAWINKQPWCNGDIGMWGSSYLAYSALIQADSSNPSLKSVFSLSGWINGAKIMSPGGAFHQMLAIPWLLLIGNTTKLSEQGADLNEMFAHLPLKDAVPQGGLDSTPDVSFDYRSVSIPIFHMNGWYDFTLQANIDAFKKISQSSSNDNQYMMLGPWYHNQIYDQNNMVGEYQIPEIGRMEINQFLELATDWFQYTLNGKSFDYMIDDRINYYVMFHDEWQTTNTWPPKNKPRTFFLNKENQLTSKKASKEITANNYLFDPNNPTPTWGGANFYALEGNIGILDQKQIEERKDVVSFTSPAFSKSELIAGTISVELYISTEGRGTDFTAKLTLVDKEGVSKNLTDDIIRLLPDSLKGKIEKVNFELPDIAFKVFQGEKVRLQISSSNYPKFNRNPNSGIDPLKAEKLMPVQQSIIYSKKFPSKITLPIIKE